jgi:hypothetical protein
MFEGWIHLPFCFFIGSWRLPEPGLRDRPCGLDPRNALLYSRTPGRTWKFIVDLVQQAPDFGHLGAELLTQRFCIAGEDMDALECESQPRVEEDALDRKGADPLFQGIENGNTEFGGSESSLIR